LFLILKNYVNHILVFLVALFTVTQAHSQELQMNVNIDDSQYQLADKAVFEELKTSIEEFVNTRNWTEDEYEYYEKINCNLSLTILPTSSQTKFYCKASIQSSRPVYNSGYNTSMVSFLDEYFDFEYTEGQPVEFNDNSYTTELASLLGFYCYFILGTDYNSFAPSGGYVYLQKALQVKNTNPNASAAGWQNSVNETNNRFRLIENAMNPQFDPFHLAIYKYHLQGLDNIAEDNVGAQKEILQSLRDISSVYDLNPESILISSFCIAKRTEFVQIFKGANAEIQEEAIKLLRKIDPANSEKYLSIKD